MMSISIILRAITPEQFDYLIVATDSGLFSTSHFPHLSVQSTAGASVNICSRTVSFVGASCNHYSEYSTSWEADLLKSNRANRPNRPDGR